MGSWSGCPDVQPILGGQAEILAAFRDQGHAVYWTTEILRVPRAMAGEICGVPPELVPNGGCIGPGDRVIVFPAPPAPSPWWRPW